MWAPSRRVLPGLVKPKEFQWFGGPRIPLNGGNLGYQLIFMKYKICKNIIGIHQNYSIAFIPKRFASLRSGIIEFAGLANYNWPGADDHDAVDICAFRHWVASLPDTFSPIPARRVGAI